MSFPPNKIRWHFSSVGRHRPSPFGISSRAQLDTTTTDGRANLPVCPNLTASQRSQVGTMGLHRSARLGGSLGGGAPPPYLDFDLMNEWRRVRLRFTSARRGSAALPWWWCEAAPFRL